MPNPRLNSIDTLRGLVMALMTLDHTRDFFSAAHFPPTDLTQTTVSLFLTRWITHYCAPVFVFLAGTSIYLWRSRHGARASASGFLIRRGLVLLILTVTVEAWSWNFLNDFRHIDGGVLWAIAWSMLAMAALVQLPDNLILLFAVGMITAHNAFDGLNAAALGWFEPWWKILHAGGKIELGQGWTLNPYYPLIPWIGVMALGHAFGRMLSSETWRAPGNLSLLGGLCLTAFIALRLTNLYGDPDPWQVQPDPAFSILSFLNCHKYPPSLQYLLMTLGPALLFLAACERWPGLNLGLLRQFGRAPLVFYLLHLYLIHGSALLLAALTGGPAREIAAGGIWNKALPSDYGYSLPIVYAITLLVLLALYPLCRGFENLKNRKPNWRLLQYF